MPTSNEPSAAVSLDEQIKDLESTVSYLQRDMQQVVEMNRSLILLTETLAREQEKINQRIAQWPFVKVPA